MKWDYKPSYMKRRKPIVRHLAQAGLGAIGVLCLSLAFMPHKKSADSISVSSISKSTKPSITSIPLEIPNITLANKVFDTNLQNIKIDAESVNKPTASTQATNVAAVKESRKAPETKTADEETLNKTVLSLKEKPEEKPVAKWQDIKIRSGDTLAKIFNRQGLSTKDLHEIMTSGPTEPLASLQVGQTLKLKIDQNKQVHGITLDIGPGDTLTVSRLEEGFQTEHKKLPIEKQIAFGKGEIKDSLFRSGKRAGLDHNILAQMVEIFGWNIDFALDLQPNDTFRVLFEEKYVEGERIDTGHILAAEIINDGKKHQAIRYTDKSGNTAYFSPEGFGMHQAFLRAPVNFARVSSNFGMRNHPILHKMRQHKGVDYSAPVGTPVQATGDAKVIFVGTRGGYGKTIELQHGSRYSTLYAHLSRFGKNIKVGTEIKQGQVIGYVGKTGLATGPHLHYEFRIDGVHRDPLTVALPKKNPISDKQKHHFLAHAKEMLRLMDMHENKVAMARNEFPMNE